MPSGWDVYYVVFLSAALALAIPSALGLISFVFFPGRKIRQREVPSSELEAPPAQTSVVGKRVNIRFFLATNSAVLLIALALVIVPCAGALHHSGDGPNRQELARALFAMVSIAVLASLGLLYSASKGDLSWLRSFQAPAPGQTPSNGSGSSSGSVGERGH